MGTRSRNVEQLQRDVCWALEHGLGPRDLVPMLERLESCAKPGSSPHLFAMTQLAEVVVASAPWRAALLCRRVIATEASARAHGILGLAQTLLGNYRSAARAYRQALALDPADASCAHNLGHLLDAIFGRPAQALPLLRAAHQALPWDEEIAGSYAHALQRCGRLDSARRVLSRALGSDDAAQRLLNRWAGAGSEPPREHALG